MSYSSDECEELVENLRELCHKNAHDKEIIELITNTIKDSPINSYFYDLVTKAADVNLQDALNLQKNNIRYEIETRLEAEYEIKVEKIEHDYETLATYDLIENRFLSEKRFRDRILNRIRSDLTRSKENGEVPELFDRALAVCDHQVIISMLLEKFSNELVEKFRPELIDRIFKENEQSLREEIKTQIKNDKNFMLSLKNELLDDVAMKLFD